MRHPYDNALTTVALGVVLNLLFAAWLLRE